MRACARARVCHSLALTLTHASQSLAHSFQNPSVGNTANCPSSNLIYSSSPPPLPPSPARSALLVYRSLLMVCTEVDSMHRAAVSDPRTTSMRERVTPPPFPVQWGQGCIGVGARRGMGWVQRSRSGRRVTLFLLCLTLLGLASMLEELLVPFG